MLKNELKKIFSSPKIFIPIIAVLFIPVLYSGILLWAFWDPYGQLDKLPVAVVNQDAGTTFNNKTLNVGHELVTSLKDNKKFAWKFVDEQTARKGLDDGTYYMELIIPKDFSANAATLSDENPKKLEMMYIPNGSRNFVATQIGSSAMEKVKEEVASNISSTYAKVMFDNIHILANGLVNASSGAEKISTGIHSASDGMTTLSSGVSTANNASEKIATNLDMLATSTTQFKQGMSSAKQGSQQLQTGLTTLNNRVPQLITGEKQLLQGVNKVKSGAITIHEKMNQVGDGLQQLNKNMPLLVNGATEASDGATKLAGGLTKWNEGATTTLNGATNVTNGLQQLVAKLTQLQLSSTDPVQKATYQTLLQNTQALATGSTQVAGGIAQLTNSATQLQQGSQQLATGIQTLAEKQQQVAGGISKLSTGQQQLFTAMNQLVAGQTNISTNMGIVIGKMTEMQTGVNKLTTGSRELVNGLTKLSSGAVALESGAKQLASGSHQLSTGLIKLVDGTSQLSTGMTKLQTGSNELQTKLAEGANDASKVKATDKTYDMFARPVDLQINDLHKIPNYGTGITPYFASLGLFVGALLLTIVFPVREPVIVPKSGLQWFFGKFGVLLIVGVLQSLLLDAILLIGLDLDVQNVFYFFLMSLVTSLTFLAIVQFLVTILDNPGRFIAIILLILQLATSAGTFPLELAPDALKPLHAFLPMAYSVDGFRAVISSGDFSQMFHDMLILGVFAVICMAGTIAYFAMMKKIKYTRSLKEEVSTL